MEVFKMSISSTINLDKLGRLPLYIPPPTYTLQKDPGNGCFLDPPGYPTYFTRSVYTMYGNNPRKGAQMVISGRVVESSQDWKFCKDWDAYRSKIDARLKRLYNPLPIDHPRVRAWIQYLYAYFHHCYQDPKKGPKVEDLVICPVSFTSLKNFTDDPRFSDEWREKEKAAVEQANREIIEAARPLAIPENHRAVKIIQEYYPDYQPEVDLIENPPGSPGDWWERLDAKPTPQECPGLHGKKHPANGSWCQMCGWREELPADERSENQ
jgi:hypothetical protein